MGVKSVQREQIIMNYSVAPGLDEVEVIALAALESLPDELMTSIEGLAIKVEDFPDDVICHDLEIDSPYELISFYKSGSQISPGVIKKTANDDDVLMIYRRPLLDAWCESGEDLNILIRHVMIEEIASHFDFSDNDVEDMITRHFQGML